MITKAVAAIRLRRMMYRLRTGKGYADRGNCPVETKRLRLAGARLTSLIATAQLWHSSIL